MGDLNQVPVCDLTDIQKHFKGPDSVAFWIIDIDLRYKEELQKFKVPKKKKKQKNNDDNNNTSNNNNNR